MTRLVIVRHGNTFEAGETPRRIGARTDLPLTAAGLEQAQALARHFGDRGVSFDRALSSALLRTRQTAEAIVGKTVQIESASFLTEVDHGPDENQTDAAIAERLGDDAILHWDRDLIAPQGWEVGAEWRLPAWRAFAEEATITLPHGTVLLATSNGAARFALAALGLLSGEKPRGVKHRTGSYGVVEVSGELRLLGLWRLPLGLERLGL